MKSQSIVGVGDSMVGVMILCLVENVSFEDMVCFGVVVGSVVIINQGICFCLWVNM